MFLFPIGPSFNKYSSAISNYIAQECTNKNVSRFKPLKGAACALLRLALKT